MEEDDGSGEKRTGGEGDEMEQKGEPKYDRVFFSSLRLLTYLFPPPCLYP